MTISERCSNARLFHFALSPFIPLPVAEKLVFVIVASHWSGDLSSISNSIVARATAEEIMVYTGLSRDATDEVLSDLLREGFIEAFRIDSDKPAYAINHAIPLLYEHHFASFSLEVMKGSSLEFLHLEMDEISNEIKKILPANFKDFLSSEAGLYSLITRWHQVDVKRALMRSLQTNQFILNTEVKGEIV